MGAAGSCRHLRPVLTLDTPAFTQVARKQKGSTFPAIPPGPGGEGGLRGLKTRPGRAWPLPRGRESKGGIPGGWAPGARAEGPAQEAAPSSGGGRAGTRPPRRGALGQVAVGSAPARPQPRVRGWMRGLNDYPAPRRGGGVYSHVLTGRGPHGRFEHLLTDRAVEIIFGVGRGRGELLGHGGGWGIKEMAAAAAATAAKLAVAARGPTLREPGGGGESRQEAARARKGAGRHGAGPNAETLGPHAPGEGRPRRLLLRTRQSRKAVPGGRRRWSNRPVASLSLPPRLGAGEKPPLRSGRKEAP